MIRFSPLRTRRGKGRIRRKHAPMRGEKRCTRWKLLRRRKHAPMRAGEAELGGVGEIAPRACAHAGEKRPTHDTAIAQAKHAPMRGGGFFEGLVFLIMPRTRAQGKKAGEETVEDAKGVTNPCAGGKVTPPAPRRLSYP